MKRSFLINLLAFIGLVVFFSCAKTETTEPRKDILLGSCNVVNGTNGPIICFDSVISESRCPSDVQCVWAGYVAVKLSIKTSSGITKPFSLSTLNTYFLPPTDTLIDGYHIKLLNVNPYPKFNSPSTEKYSVELEVK